MPNHQLQSDILNPHHAFALSIHLTTICFLSWLIYWLTASQLNLRPGDFMRSVFHTVASFLSPQISVLLDWEEKKETAKKKSVGKPEKTSTKGIRIEIETEGIMREQEKTGWSYVSAELGLLWPCGANTKAESSQGRQSFISRLDELDQIHRLWQAVHHTWMLTGI